MMGIAAIVVLYIPAGLQQDGIAAIMGQSSGRFLAGRELQRLWCHLLALLWWEGIAAIEAPSSGRAALCSGMGIAARNASEQRE